MQVILDSSFARPGSAAIWGGGGEGGRKENSGAGLKDMAIKFNCQPSYTFPKILSWRVLLSSSE